MNTAKKTKPHYQPNNEKQQRALEICGRAWQDAQRDSALIRTSDGGFGAPEALAKFTGGVLKLPKGYWVDAIEALWRCDWRHAAYPIALVRRVAIAKHRNRMAAEDAGTYADGGKAAYEVGAVGEGQQHGDGRVIARGGERLDTPETVAPPKSKKTRMGYQVPASQITQGSSRAAQRFIKDAGRDNPEESLIDWLALQDCENRSGSVYDTGFPDPDRFFSADWLSEISAETPLGYSLEAGDPLLNEVVYDWDAIALAAALDADETALLKARACCEGEKQTLRYLAWTYERYRPVAKRLERRYARIKQALWANGTNC